MNVNELNSEKLFFSSSTVPSSSCSSSSPEECAETSQDLMLDTSMPAEYHPFIGNLFKKWCLDEFICMNELLGLDTFDKINEVAATLSISNKKDLETVFNGLYKSLAIISGAGALDIIAHKVILPPREKEFLTNSKFFISKERIKEEIDSLKMSLETLKKKISEPPPTNAKLKTSTKLKLEGIRLKNLKPLLDLIHNIEENLQFYFWVWDLPNPGKYLLDRNVSGYGLSSAILKNNWQENLAHLKKFIKYIDYTNNELFACGYTGAEIPIFKKILLELESSNGENEQFRKIAYLLSKTAFVLKDLNRDIHGDLSAALYGQMSYEKWCQKNGFDTSREKSQLDFCQTLIVYYAQSTLTELYVGDLLRIIDTRVLQIKSPEITTQETLLQRFVKNLQKVLQPVTIVENPKMTETGASLLIADFSKKVKTMAVQFKIAIEKNWPTNEELNSLILQLNRDSSITFSSNLYEVIFPFRRSIFHLERKILPAFILGRERILKFLKQRFGKIKTEDLTEIENLSKILTGICLKEFSHILNQIYVIRDAHYFLKCSEKNLIQYEFGEHLNPIEITDFLFLDGIQEIYSNSIRVNKLSQESAKPESRDFSKVNEETLSDVTDVSELSTVEHSEIPVDISEEKDMPKNEDCLPEFNIPNGEKVRRIIPRLIALGFTHESTKGSHMKYVHPLGAMIIMPNHVSLAVGTAKTIQKSVRETLEKNKI
jgi:predicted RNA binding protein YcfA (HicA-like mRNA interferase family)